MSTSTEPSLDRSLVSGIAWTAALRWSAQFFSWVATFYAARLLQPGDYGLVAMATLGIGMARMVEDFGLDAILVQDRSITGQKQSQLAGLLIALGVVLCALFVLLGQPLAAFFKEPHVGSIVMALSLLFLFDAVQVVPRAQMQRLLQFERLAVVTFVQVVTTSILLVSSARAGLGHWSLVINTLGGTAAATILLVLWHPYSVAWPRDIAKLSRPLLQGWRILASRASWYGYSNADQTIIGRVLGKDLLGAYSFAVTFSSLAQQEVGSIITRVVPGIFSEVQHQREELRRYFLLLTEFITVVTFPMAIGMALTADMLIPLILGPEWTSVIVPLQLLCLYSAFLASQMLVSHVLMWTGQFRVNMWCSLFQGILMVLTLLWAVRHGLPGIGWSWALVFPVLNVPSMVFAFRTVNISTRQWLDSIKPAATGCIMMSIAVLGVRALLPGTLPLEATTAISIITGAITYPAVIWFVFGRRVRSMIGVGRAIRTGQTI
ncbi:MAG TPA: lipopolysaccharide biosynthesis protein [Terriglobia bacterium]|nr:lipopolysaccharide biosynthesis protein [Terriglobia bacterium]